MGGGNIGISVKELLSDEAMKKIVQQSTLYHGFALRSLLRSNEGALNCRKLARY